MFEPFQRKISPFECLYLGGQKIVSPFMIQIFIEGEGDLDLARLQSAILQTALVCPGSRLVLRKKTWVAQECPPQVRVLSPSGSGDGFDGFRFEAVPELYQPLHPEEATCEVLLIPNLISKRFTLVFRAFHGVMDGKGTLVWIRDVMRCLRGEPPEGANSILSEYQFISQLNHPKSRRQLSFDSSSPFRSVAEESRKFFWKRRTVLGSHPAWVAKVASILSHVSNQESLKWMIPVDLRRHDLELRSTANLSLPLFLDVKKGESWEAVQERVLSDLSLKREIAVDKSEWALERTPFWAIQKFIKTAIQIQSQRQKFMASGILSHLGRVDLREFSCPGFQARTVYSLPEMRADQFKKNGMGFHCKQTREAKNGEIALHFVESLRSGP